ncbi:hypothetical protein Ancab_033553 [Ancistrocladus abbreviatus]
MFWLLLRRYASYPLYEYSHDKKWRFVRDYLFSGSSSEDNEDDFGVERAFRVIKVELHFLYDYFYTKYYAIWELHGGNWGTTELEEDFGLPNEGMGQVDDERLASNSGLQEVDGSTAKCLDNLNMVLWVLKKKKKGGSGAKEPKSVRMELKLLLRKPKGKGRTKWRRKVKSNCFEHGEVIRSGEMGEEGTPVLADAVMSRSMTS